MAGKRPDRRIGRTRRQLKEALLELVGQQPYDSISIRQITDRADVGRSTFYSHYDSKEDLLFDGFDVWLRSLAAPVAAGGSPEADGGDGAAGRPGRFRFSLPLFRHLESQAYFFRTTMSGASDGRIRRKVTAMLVEVILEELTRMGRRPGDAAEEPEVGPGLELEARAHCIAGSFWGLAAWWLECRERPSPELVDRVFQAACAPAAL